MISPSPAPPPPIQTRPVPVQTPEQPAQAEEKKVKLTPARKRVGQAPLALFIKAVFRPIFKGLYYLIGWMRKHKLAAFIAIVLLISSIFLTSYLFTGTVPLVGTGADSVQKQIKNNAQLSPEVQDWLTSLRGGNINSLIADQKNIQSARAPDTALYVLEFSEQTGMKWNSINVDSVSTAPDGTIDTYVRVAVTITSSTGTANAYILWHFTTDPGGRILYLDYVGIRQSLQ